MATYYSYQYGDSADMSALPTPRVAVTAGRKHARKRLNHCICDLSGTDPTAADVIRFCTMKSSDRIFSLKLGAVGDATAGMTIDLGVHLTGKNNDGAVVDADLFTGSPEDIGTTLVTMTEFLFDGPLTDPTDIGKTLWEMCDVGDGSYTEDPLVEMDITGTLGGTPSDGGVTHVLIEYTSGA